MDQNNKELNFLFKFALDQNAQRRVLSGASELTTELNKAGEKASQLQKRLNDLSQSADQAFKRYAKTFATGTAITGGIFAFAQNYVNNAKVATATTKEWADQTNRLTQSRNRVGEIVAKETLPMLKKAAEISEKAASIIEKNPDLVKAVLNVGVAVASLSALGMAVTKGFKIYADVKTLAASAQQLLAGKLMQEAAKEQLAAAAAGKGGLGWKAAAGLGGLGGEGAAAGGGLAGAASSVLLPIVTTVASLLAGSYLGTKLGNAVGKSAYGDQWQDKGFADSMKDVWKTTRQIVLLTSPLHILTDQAAKFGLVSNETASKVWNLQKKILGLADAADSVKVGMRMSAPAGFMGVSDGQKQLVDSYVQMQQEEKAAAKQYGADRLKIMQDYQAQELDLIRNAQMQRGQIVANYNKQVQSITDNYQKASQASEQSYATQRAQIVRDAGLEIQRIEKDHQDAMRKLLMEHNDRVNDLVASRDALGLVREMRDYDRKRQEAEAETNKEIARRRQDVAQNLRDMAQQHAQERAARLADYKQQLKDAEIQKKEQLKQVAAQYKAERDAAQKAKTQALRDLETQYKNEQERRRAAFVAQIRDLDANMLGEQKRKQQYYVAMLKDVEAFAAAYRKALPSGGSGVGGGVNVPVRDMGGYATKGLYGLAQDGRTEFVLSGGTTKAAEAAIGGSLTQERLLAALSGRGAAKVYNDNRRIDSRISLADRLQLKQDMLEMLNGVM